MKPYRLRNAWMFIFVICILMIFNTMGMSGCMKKNNTTKVRLNINTAALLYMQEKYGEKFEYYKPYGNSMSGTHSLLVRCASLPDQDILVSIENYRRENKVFLDNYLAVKYREETIEFFMDCARRVFGEAKIHYDVAYEALSPDLSTTATLNEFLSDRRVSFVVMVEIKESDFTSEEQAEQLAELIATTGRSFYLTIVIVSDREYGSFNRESLNKHVSLNGFIHCAKITNFNNNIETRWLGKE